ncbi:MAG TPA: universal stress protein [Nitrososphaeraceae archaeon]|jgi:nucleotide-binding universal stress UspA family protein|nr:universal stress protein [Nitrososphaeraceae archaeon]
MIAYNKILVPYDSSKLSETALEHAIQIAKMSIGYSRDNIVNVILFYVTPVIHIPVTVGTILLKSNKTGKTISLTQYIKELHQEIKENAIKMLNEKIKEYKNVENISLQSKVIIGEPANEIIKFANDEKMDLIIMGTTGLGGIKKFVFGSVARKVSEKAPCPVMLVR